MKIKWRNPIHKLITFFQTLNHNVTRHSLLFFTYLLSVHGLSILPPTALSAYIYLQPVFAMIIGIIIAYNQDTATGITFEKMAATLLIFVGVYLVGRTKK